MERIYKKEFIDNLAEYASITKKSAAEQYENVFGVLNTLITNGNEVSIPDIGCFKIIERAPRTARNPQTNEVIQVPAKKSVKFQVTKSVKDVVAQL